MTDPDEPINDELNFHLNVKQTSMGIFEQMEFEFNPNSRIVLLKCVVERHDYTYYEVYAEPNIE